MCFTVVPDVHLQVQHTSGYTSKNIPSSNEAQTQRSWNSLMLLFTVENSTNTALFPALFRSHNLLWLPTTQTESQGLFSCQVGEGDVKHKTTQF